MSISATGLFGAGAFMVFAPDEASGALALGSHPIVLQLLGAALVGFGMMNWTARGSMLGGIYGRAVVVGNQVHMTVGALALAKYGMAAGGPPAYWFLTLVYVLGALLFLYLMFGGGPRQPV